MNFHHVGIACKSIDETLAFVKAHFDIADISETVYDEQQKADLCMVRMQDGYQLELISGEVVKTYLKKRQYLYHTCYEVDSIEKAIEELQKGCVLVSPPKEAVLFGGKRVAFLMTPLGLIELVEERKAGGQS